MHSQDKSLHLNAYTFFFFLLHLHKPFNVLYFKISVFFLLKSFFSCKLQEMEEEMCVVGDAVAFPGME